MLLTGHKQVFVNCVIIVNIIYLCSYLHKGVGEVHQNIQLSQVDASIPFQSLSINVDSQGTGNFLTNIFFHSINNSTSNYHNHVIT